MNVNNFFKFIGDKYPIYKLSADNKELIQHLKNGYENGVAGGQEDDGYRFVPLEVEGKGYVDENGKQGLFLQIIGSYQVERLGYDEPNDYHYSYQTTYCNYKNDKLNGIRTIIGGWDDKAIEEIQYENGLRNGPTTKYRGGIIDTVTHYVNDAKKSVDEYYKNGNIAHTYYYKQIQMGRDMVDRMDETKPREFYDPEGNPIDKETYHKTQQNMYRLDR
jgi:hypothetical protein